MAADVAMAPSLHQTHTLTFFVATLLCLAIAVLPPLFVKRDRRWERRVFWAGSGAAVLCVFLATLPDWKLAIGTSVFIGGGMVFTAYVYTPYLRLHGRNYAFHIHDSQPDPPSDGSSPPSSDDPDYDPAPDSYGGSTTARKAWWVFIFAMALCAFNVVVRVVERDNLWAAALGAAILVVFGIVLGYGDAIWGYPVARGQRLQFVIVSVITAGVFTALYLGGYLVGKRWPVRRKQSMEYRAHPRHQKRYP